MLGYTKQSHRFCIKVIPIFKTCASCCVSPRTSQRPTSMEGPVSVWPIGSRDKRQEEDFFLWLLRLKQALLTPSDTTWSRNLIFKKTTLRLRSSGSQIWQLVFHPVTPLHLCETCVLHTSSQRLPKLLFYATAMHLSLEQHPGRIPCPPSPWPKNSRGSIGSRMQPLEALYPVPGIIGLYQHCLFSRTAPTDAPTDALEGKSRRKSQKTRIFKSK